MNASLDTKNSEREVHVLSGWVMLPIVILMLLGGIASVITSIAVGVAQAGGAPVWWLMVLGVVSAASALLMLSGFFTLQPNEGRVLILFGAYKGTVRASGFHWGNPFYSNGPVTKTTRRVGRGHGESSEAETASRRTGVLSRNKISLRARNMNSEKLKVNDKRGNPIEIAAVVVWRVHDTAQAMFDVDDFEHFVTVQSESAVRHLASCYAYDHGEEHESTLRSNVDEISGALQEELGQRLHKAGVQVDEARLTHLAYAPEIAQAMLRRQQAEAVIAARQKIVQGAVGMVDMALKELAEKSVVELDSERRAAMVSNLMVVLCGESEVHPVINTGTLYN